MKNRIPLYLFLFSLFILSSCKEKQEGWIDNPKTGYYRVMVDNLSDDVLILDAPDGNRILNTLVLKNHNCSTYLHFSSYAYLHISEIKDSIWLKIESFNASGGGGWIRNDSMRFKKVNPNETNKFAIQPPRTSSGYSPDPNYTPTVDPKGNYHTIDGDAKQRQYQGSKEQKDHLDEMKKRGW